MSAIIAAKIIGISFIEWLQLESVRECLVDEILSLLNYTPQPGNHDRINRVASTYLAALEIGVPSFL